VPDPVVETQPSVEDRIASRFGGLPSAQEEVTETVEEVVDDGLTDLEWEGATYKVPKAIKDSLLRNDDYTRKTMELSEKRKEIETLRETWTTRQQEIAFGESIGPERQRLELIDAYLKQASQIDSSSMTMEQIFRHKMEIDSVKEQRATLKESIDEKRAAFTEQMKSRLSELRGKAKELAAKSIPNFGEDTEKAMREYAKAEGLTESELDSVLMDPRSYTIVWKAAQYDQIKAGTQKATQTVARTLKPGAASERMPQKTISSLNLQKGLKAAGHDSNAKARVIEGFLESRFGK
jgi:hypothetical protein